ncbi:MAG: flagellar basal-body rod protein FlgG [Gemmatimonadetes bacterium]|nr:flagellar basal-body rod protein FlgG [Gemmatimonadota bacterium]MCA9763190.1 flagellar basal-body rod protein FlgG [Gemmatimonadota bacterium]MCB9518841.1 flagellar basal-body rod protein FlgG [Gemmatimonadales bacterium]HPF62190.1 flagellar basal-body rod protein FlgG [Gemmatimonadales bacterium]HRX19705.1 flagellar basal-body rod protein FlgG [Gemmatimonadales bacterium]
MTDGMRTSASGMIAQQKRVDVIANNLANVNTTGFKRSRANFEDLLYETVQGPRTTAAQGIVGPMQIGHGVRLASITRIHGQGGPEVTGRPLDIAIEGEGFFQVEMPDGTLAYTRDGSFSLSDSGQLVTSGGNALVPDIVIPPDATAVTISETGAVSVTNGMDGSMIEVGRLELARFPNPTGLLALGGNLFGETVASGFAATGFPQEDGFGRVLQGTLETSNVEIVQEMTDMIAAQRAYEINARAIRAAEDMMQSINDLIR